MLVLRAQLIIRRDRDRDAKSGIGGRERMVTGSLGINYIVVQVSLEKKM